MLIYSKFLLAPTAVLPRYLTFLMTIHSPLVFHAQGAYGMKAEIEGVLFIPSTPGSGLRKLLQEAEDRAALMMNTPSVRIVERAGTKIMDEVGDTDPWRNEWCCQRKSCLPCQGQEILGAEREKAALELVGGSQGGETQREASTSWPKEDCRSISGYTKEGCNYVIECLECRRQGVKRRY